MSFLLLQKTSVDTVHLHPNQLKLLIHSRDSLLRMLDLRRYIVKPCFAVIYFVNIQLLFNLIFL